jgi:pimeloyl-ACP methyl ester carboxylesterase
VNHAAPVLLIHGFSGIPEGWAILRGELIARGADPELVRFFHYGWLDGEDQSVYDNRGDIRIIASRLSKRETSDPDALRSQVTRLSEASLERGGPREVTIVAHSMGGLVARYYLSRRVPDEWGTVNEGVVARLITIGTPHLGADLARVAHLVPQGGWIWKVLEWLEKVPFFRGNPTAELARLEAEVEALQVRVQAQEMPLASLHDARSPALRQITPGSEFLRELNRPDAFPPDVEAILLWGDVQVGGAVRWGPLPLWQREVSLGDLLVTAESASNLPGVNPLRYPLVWQRRYLIQADQRAVVAFNLADHLPPVAHGNLLRNPEVLDIVARSVGL